jgi:hypothetical protein
MRSFLVVAGTTFAIAAHFSVRAEEPVQGIAPEVLARYHHTDQGTRLMPAAWLAALEKPDGSGKVMNRTDLETFGFLFDSGVPDQVSNPYGWPIGWTVSDPAKDGGIAIVGFSCAMCHTGRIDRAGRTMIIEGGQPMIDLFPFVGKVVASLTATAEDRVKRQQFIKDAIAAGYPADRMESDLETVLARLSHLAPPKSGSKFTMLPGGPGRIDAVQGIANRVFATDIGTPTNERDATAPVNYPYLWDIWRLSRLQYNGLLPKAADFRNIGEVLGTEGRTNIVGADGTLNPEPERWKTSLQIENLRWMEETLRGLKAPVWPESLLGPIDQGRAAAGRVLFTAHCAGCHGIKALPDGTWDVAIVPLSHIGTDPNQATNFAGYTYDLSELGLPLNAPAWLGLQNAVTAIRQQLYNDAGISNADREGPVEVQAPCGYKARPLIGVWATPPFLHNGSVRTVFELLSEERSTRFRYGTREYDPMHLGYTEDASANDAILDTSVSGNHATGHWFTDETDRPGRIGPAFANADKLAIIEFLKAASYDNYPSEPRKAAAKIACENDKGWARSAMP